jgi:LysM repeat protein
MMDRGGVNDSGQLYSTGDSGGGMRAFFVVILFFLAFLLFASSSLAGVNLTSNTGAGAPSATLATTQPQVITIQQSPTKPSQSGALVPVTGGCTNPYTIQPGDSLSQIAVNCNTSLAAIRQANQQIASANLIYPGQQLNIPNGSTVQIPITGKEEATAIPQPSATALVPVSGLIPAIQPGTGLQVRGINYPPNTPVNVAIGQQSVGYTVVTSGVTDASGNLTTQITIPAASNSQSPWVVVVSTTNQPTIQAMSQPFTIGP